FEEELVVSGRRGQELLVLGQVELAVGLEEGVRVELRRRRETSRLTDLRRGGFETASPDLILNQPLGHELIPGELLDLLLLRLGDRIRRVLLALADEVLVDRLVLIEAHRLAVDPTDLARR